MITIERMGRPFNVTEQVAAAIEKADLVKEKQQLEEQNEQLREELEMAAMATSDAHDGGAEWSFDSSDGTPVSLAGHTYRLDSDRFDSLYDSGLIGCLQTENGQYWADSVTLDSLHDSGLVVLDESGVYMDAKCTGRGWMPGGPGGKCKRAPKGTAKKVASETAGINRLAKGGTKNKARSARLAELRGKLGRASNIIERNKSLPRGGTRGVISEEASDRAARRKPGRLEKLGANTETSPIGTSELAPLPSVKAKKKSKAKTLPDLGANTETSPIGSSRLARLSSPRKKKK